MKPIKFLLLTLGMLFLPTLVFSQQNGVQQIAPHSVAVALAEGAIFVDVRETNEVETLAYDLEGVINIPLSELPGRLAELPRDQDIVLACRSGKRSIKAAALLAENNFTRLYNLTDGIVGWAAAELPVRDADRSTIPSPMASKQCCSAKGAGKGEGKSCGTKETGSETAEASCGGKAKGKAKGKSCCAGGSR